MGNTFQRGRMCCLVVLASAFIAQGTVAQDVASTGSTETTQSFFSRKNLITYGIVAHSIFTTYIEYQWWWKGDYHPFTVMVEGFMHDYSLGVDKFGHLYTSHFYFHTLYNLLKWGGYDQSTTLWVSSLIPAIYAFSIELGDGYSSFHFSPDDLAFNYTGILYGVLQEKYPFLENFRIKWSYVPKTPRLSTFSHPFSSDYDGHIYWMTFNVHNLLPEPVAQYWPRFLNLAVGYGGEGISIIDTGPKLRKVAIGFDYNLTTIPLEGDTWEVVKNIVDLFHFPAPGVRFVESEPTEFRPLLLH